MFCCRGTRDEKGSPVVPRVGAAPSATAGLLAAAHREAQLGSSAKLSRLLLGLPFHCLDYGKPSTGFPSLAAASPSMGTHRWAWHTVGPRQSRIRGVRTAGPVQPCVPVSQHRGQMLPQVWLLRLLHECPQCLPVNLRELSYMCHSFMEAEGAHSLSKEARGPPHTYRALRRSEHTCSLLFSA